MQDVSNEYKESMSSPERNRGYIIVNIGVVNLDAQDNMTLTSSNSLAYWSNASCDFSQDKIKNYATGEQNYSKLDGTMYFLPEEGSGYSYYNDGIVTNNILGGIYVSFDQAYDLMGLSINFGENYPTEFSVETNNGVYIYRNVDELWTTEDMFDGITYINITPITMLDGKTRMRIYSLRCGIDHVYTNDEVMDYTSSEVVSPIADSISSFDVTVTINNEDGYYDPDNEDSALYYLEIGQELSVKFGYDVSGDGDIEYTPPQTAYLSAWEADETSAKFTAVDMYTYLTNTYNNGVYSASGTSLYDLAVAVLTDAGVSTSDYFIDGHLKKIYVNNPIPAVTHSEALQLIANAGRCTLTIDRQGRIHIQSSYRPDMTASSNGETDYSNATAILIKDDGAVTALEYARYKLTAEKYASYQLNAYQYATQAKSRLGA